MKKNLWVLLAAYLVLLHIIIFVLINPFGMHSAAQTATINNNAYYAVFLSNGQVYFGHISGITADVITLTKVFYLKTTSVANGKNTTNNSLQLSLVKLGKEILAPKDAMTINRVNVEFWEELQDASGIVKAIKEYKP